MASRRRAFPDKDPLLAAYLEERLTREVSRDGRDEPAPDVRQVAQWALPLVQCRRPGAHLVRVSNRENGSSRTVIELLMADQPFLVDSFRQALRRLGLRERLFLHWLLAIERDEDGSVAELGDGAGSVREAYLYAEVPAIADEGQREEIALDLQRLFEDVHHVYADHGRLVHMIRKHTADIEFAGTVDTGSGPSPVELMDFLAWIADDNYVFFGYRAYRVSRDGDSWRVQVEPDSGLGLMRDPERSRFHEEQSGDDLPDLLLTRLRSDRLVFFDKSRSASTIHREGRLDCINVKVLDERGQVSGFGCFIGMLTHKAIRTRASDIPMLRERREKVLEQLGLERGSHDCKAAIEVFDSLPPEFLFSYALADVTRVVQQLLGAIERGRVEIAVVPDPLNRSFFLSAILPRTSYEEDLRHELHRLLSEKYHANYIEHRSSFVDDEVALIHFFCTSQQDVDMHVLSELEADVRECAASWEDRFESALLDRYTEQEVDAIVSDYAEAFGRDYRSATSVADACVDVAHLERIRSDESDVEIASLAGLDGPGSSRLRIYLPERPFLTDLLPVLDNCGVRVDAATLTEVPGLSPSPLWIVTCRTDASDPGCSGHVIDALREVLRGSVENGRLNRLVLGAYLEWQEADLLRAYLAYAQQLGIAPQIRAAASTLLRHPDATRALITLFRVRFDPDLEGDRDMAQRTALEAVAHAREPVRRFDEDGVFGLLKDLILATDRTGFFIDGPRGEHQIVLKMRPEKLEGLPPPRPSAEVFVHSAEMSGVHLRGGPVARGGIRWSDRVQDFRREILGLMKTQRVKNGLIVPAGAKGGFVLKRRPENRREARKLADRQYARFVAALLSITDNVVNGEVARPIGVVAHDGDDPYLVVAADKGTAQLSDVANRVAEECGYWLGDAFASGGSQGYDHKKMGITARGAWVCARRHLMEIGISVDDETFTVAGIGDMSGDVFGNGMLLARRAKLLAAFDDRHVFVDPDPNPEAAWAERKRLFELPRSGWSDYDRAKISAGGGVFERSAKVVEVSAEARAALGIAATSMSGEELVRAILRMPVDLLWNGGIGTYVKAGSETHAEVGDRANDRVRVDGAELRARVVAEGGNLGFTQRGRVEFALRGGRLYTDAVDNSGGVDLSDREVNYKILLLDRCASDAMSREQRDEVLRDCAEDAARAVLANSASQSRCISLDALRAQQDAERMELAAEFLVESGRLDADLEFLPDREELRARVKATGRGYTPPELAILVGYTKMLVKRELVASQIPDHEAMQGVLDSYFPEPLRVRFAEEIAAHPLRREITATCLSNRVIDLAGVTLVPELCSALGVGVAEVVAAYHTVDRLLEADHLRFRIDAEPVSESARLAAVLRVEESIRVAARSPLVLERRELLDAGEFADWTVLVRCLRELTEQQLASDERSALEIRAQRLVELGIERDLAVEIEHLAVVVRALGVISLAVESETRLERVVETHARIGRETRIAWLLERLGELDRRHSWDRVAAEGLHVEMLETQRDLTARLLGGASSAGALGRFMDEHGAALRRIHDTVSGIEGSEAIDLAPLSVLAHHIRRLARNAAG